jgi:hypothetical protein
VRVLVEKSEGKNRSNDFDVDGEIILKCTFKKCNGEAWTELIWLTIRTNGRLLNSVTNLEALKNGRNFFTS